MVRIVIAATVFALVIGCEPSHPKHDIKAVPQAQESRVSTSYEQIAELARQAGLTPAPLKSGPNPGVLREGKPWSGTFVWSSHKTSVIVEEYKNGQRDGLSLGYHSEGIKHWEARYLEGALDGVCRVWDAAGNLRSTKSYKNGVLVEQDE
ncbi:MAG: toxin-antitoxin system YwqK family antitoxin [Planctomycetota bacterium]